MSGEEYGPLKKLEAYWFGIWQRAWERDPWQPEYRRESWHNYGDGDRYVFDRETGELLFESEDDLEVAADNRRRVEANQDRYEEIPPLTHGDHHEIFAEWLQTSVDQEVVSECNTDSIGGFFDSCRGRFSQEQARLLREDWDRFHDRELQARAEEWLRERGWKVEWM